VLSLAGSRAIRALSDQTIVPHLLDAWVAGRSFAVIFESLRDAGVRFGRNNATIEDAVALLQIGSPTVDFEGWGCLPAEASFFASFNLVPIQWRSSGATGRPAGPLRRQRKDGVAGQMQRALAQGVSASCAIFFSMKRNAGSPRGKVRGRSFRITPMSQQLLDFRMASRIALNTVRQFSQDLHQASPER
jgi:hypothetical protein